eukprot:CAMPEP_0206432838 /NCGR_PEP_ID=MMETSP0324_2-20121206/8188_1 /ASSEMBLY_ACC=CAM_ASM_000836 /TAXON_ID=2866 /ORGANISM="Crypthecodinium cohnii, Strain Seligo" /LENGTH=162 /DNA_ID=CAMNT_0053899013 /DNA_START=368 /DNA_END=853 /DNA_ORIENTATION=+
MAKHSRSHSEGSLLAARDHPDVKREMARQYKKILRREPLQHPSIASMLPAVHANTRSPTSKQQESSSTPKHSTTRGLPWQEERVPSACSTALPPPAGSTVSSCPPSVVSLNHAASKAPVQAPDIRSHLSKTAPSNLGGAFEGSGLSGSDWTKSDFHSWRPRL